MPAIASNGIRRVVGRINPDSAPDGELLNRFLAYRDEDAFTALVNRHAAMVLGTCRRVLANVTDSDDAFQATFVVLLRKAHSLTNRDCIGNFLYGVAYHTALKARAMALKRLTKESLTQPQEAVPDQTDLLKALDEELSKLPEKYREPVVLCELEGRPRQEVASTLGIPEGTISSRLATSHRMLEKRLKARGFASVCIAAVLAGQTTAVPVSLANTIIRGMTNPSVHVSQLASEATKMLLLHKLGLGFSMLLMAALALFLGATSSRVSATAEKAPTARKEDPKPAIQKPANAEPAWKTEFRKAYGLKDDESIRRVAPPYPECRVDYFRNRDLEFFKGRKIEPTPQDVNRDYSNYFTKFGWKDGWTVDSLIMHTVPIKPEVGVTLKQAFKLIAGINGTRIDGDEELLERKVTGDFVVRAGADTEKIVLGLEKILQKECDLSVTLALRDTERDVYVLSGNYESKPLAGREQNEIEVFAYELKDRNLGGGGSGTLQTMADHVEGWINACIVLGEVHGAPKNVSWHYNDTIAPFTKEQNERDRNPEAVMTNIATQTGLKVKLETKKVRVLEVKKMP